MPDTLMKAVEKILREDPKTRESKNNWMFFVKVLREMGFQIYIKFDRNMPSPETIFRERREIMNKRNEYPNNFVPESNVTYEKPREVKKNDE